jgi:hypothetical protein
MKSAEVSNIRELTHDETMAVGGGFFFAHLFVSAAVIVAGGSLIVRDLMKEPEAQVIDITQVLH